MGGSSAVSSYLEALPSDLESYPDHLHKAAIFREFLVGLDTAELAEAVPSELAPLVLTPPPVNAWLPEVHAHAVYIAACDVLFADEAAFVRAAYENNLRLLESPLYNILFKLVSPERVLGGAASRWSKFHRGQELVLDEAGHGRAVVRLVAPMGLTTPLLARCYGTGFRAAIEAAGGAGVKVEVEATGRGGYRFEARWR